MTKRGGWASLQHRWGRFLRDGLQTSRVRLSVGFVLLFWAFALLISELLLRRLGFAPSLGAATVPLREPDSAFWSGRRLIFAASAGRGGSGYLRAVLACGDGVLARHEPAPRMAGDDLAAVMLRGERKATLSARRARKLGAVRNALEGTKGDVVYAETTHMFVKTFADAVIPPLVDAGAEVVVVVPTRPLVDVLMSQLRLGWFRPEHAGRGAWYYAPDDVVPAERVVNASGKSVVDMAVGYNLDVRARTQRLRRIVKAHQAAGEWAGVRFVDVKVEDIAPGNADGIEKFLQAVGLKPVAERVKLLTAADGNRRDEKKDRVHGEVNKDEVRRKLFEMNEVSV